MQRLKSMGWNYDSASGDDVKAAEVLNVLLSGLGLDLDIISWR